MRGRESVIRKRALLLGLFLTWQMSVFVAAPIVCGQQIADKSGSQHTDIDPLALQVLKAATDPIHDAKSYSFRALVSREQFGTNGQIITQFTISNISVERPDKLHIDFQGHGKKVQLFYNAGHTVLYTPEEKLYTTISSPTTVDATLEALSKRNIFIPTENFLASDPYHSLTNRLLTGYVVGRAMLFDQEVHQLAFTEPDAEWQMWVVGGDKPMVRRVEIVDKRTPQHPRITIDFLDWNLNPSLSPDLFTFSKPPDAKEIDVLKESARK